MGRCGCHRGFLAARPCRLVASFPSGSGSWRRSSASGPGSFVLGSDRGCRDLALPVARCSRNLGRGWERTGPGRGKRVALKAREKVQRQPFPPQCHFRRWDGGRADRPEWQRDPKALDRLELW